MNFYDTNMLLSNLDYVKENGEFRISYITLSELEGIKTSAIKSEEVKYQARKAARFLAENITMWGMSIYKDKDLNPETIGLPNTNDSKIILSYYYDCLNETVFMHDNLIFVTNDLLCGLFAEYSLGINKVLILSQKEQKIYSGYEEVKLSNDEFTEVFDQYEQGKNPYNLIENQYLIIHCNDKTHEYSYRDGKLVSLKLPKGIKGLNAKQRCVLDLLDNEDIPIKVICGVYGTGKTYLSVNVAVNKLKAGKNIGKMFLVRQPYGEGDEIGYLKGTKEEKIKDFFNPIIDNLDGGEFLLDSLFKRGQVECEVPFYMKGRSLPYTMILVDEAEDLTLKQIRMLGSRISEKSNVVFIGDWHQASGKYEYNCGLVQFIKYVQEHPSPLVGVMVMDEDVRSDASKYFADVK